MKLISSLLVILCMASFTNIYSQSVGVGTTNPNNSAILDVSSTSKGVLLPRMTFDERMAMVSPPQGLLVYQTNDKNLTQTGFYVYGGAAWHHVLQSNDISQYTGWQAEPGDGYTYTTRYVGIFTASPTYPLDVNGSMRSFNGYFTNRIGIGTTSPTAGLHLNGKDMLINDGSIQLNALGVEKGFIHLSGDNLRIGTNSANDNGKVIIRTNATDRVTVDGSGNMAVTGDITTGGKGVLYNAANSNNLRYYTRTVYFEVVNLAAHGITSETAIGFAGFSAAPEVIVGDIVSTGGTTGPLYKLQLVIYDVTASGCKARISNTSNATINQNITWNLICVGR